MRKLILTAHDMGQLLRYGCVHIRDDAEGLIRVTLSDTAKEMYGEARRIADWSETDGTEFPT